MSQQQYCWLGNRRSIHLWVHLYFLLSNDKITNIFWLNNIPNASGKYKLSVLQKGPFHPIPVGVHVCNLRPGGGAEFAGLDFDGPNSRGVFWRTWIFTDQIYNWTCMMTGQESERPTKSQGQQLFTSRLQPTRVKVRNVDSRESNTSRISSLWTCKILHFLHRQARCHGECMSSLSQQNWHGSSTI